VNYSAIIPNQFVINNATEDIKKKEKKERKQIWFPPKAVLQDDSKFGISPFTPCHQQLDFSHEW